MAIPHFFGGPAESPASTQKEIRLQLDDLARGIQEVLEAITESDQKSSGAPLTIGDSEPDC